MTTRGDIIGDAVSDALNSPPLDVTGGTLDERKHRIWRAICNALEPWFEEAWIDVYDDPTTHDHFITGTTPYPMETIAWQLTPSTEVPVAIWVKNGTAVRAWSQLWPATGAYFPGYYEYNPEPVGVPNPGDDARVPHGNHVHGPGDSLVYRGKLWTAYVQDPYAGGAVDAMYTGWDVCGAGFLFGGQWAEGPTGTWTRATTGWLPYVWLDGETPFAGMFVLAWHDGLTSSELKYAGLYEVVNPGGVGIQPVMRRTDGFNLSSNYVNGMWFSVTGGTIHAGEFWQLTIPDPFVLNITDQEWASVAQPADASVRALLSASQIGRASSATVTGSTNVANGNSDTLVECTTTEGILSGQTLVAGQPWECHLKVKLTADDPAATTLVLAYVASTSGSWELLAESAPIHNESYETIVFPGTLASNYEIPLGEELRIRFRAYSTSVGGVEVSFIYNESDHPSWIQTPMEVGGSGVHNDFSGRSVNYSAGGCHPADAIGPGRLHRNMGTATESGGHATMPSDASQASLTLAGSYLYSIDSTGFSHGDPIMVFVDNATAATPKWLVDGASNVGAFYGLKLAMMGGTVQSIGMKGKTTCHLWFDGTNSCWRLSSLPVTHFDP